MMAEGAQTIARVSEVLGRRGFDASTAQSIVDELEQRHGYELGAILMVGRASERLEPLALSKQGNDDRFLAQDLRFVSTEQSLECGITRWVASTGEAVLSNDVRGDSRYFALRDNIRSELCVPIRFRGRLHAVLNTETERRDAYRESDLRLLRTVGMLIAATLDANAPTESEPVVTCAWCRSVRLDDRWLATPDHVTVDFGIEVSHGICPDCVTRMLASLSSGE